MKKNLPKVLTALLILFTIVFLMGVDFGQWKEKRDAFNYSKTPQAQANDTCLNKALALHDRSIFMAQASSTSMNYATYDCLTWKVTNIKGEKI